MKKAVTFGEIMLRLSPPGRERFLQAQSFDAVFGGSEANVAAALSILGADSAFVTKLPANELGAAAENSLRRFGTDTGFIAKGGERLGLYFLEKGASQRPSKVIYDRAGSALALASRTDFDWDKIFDGARWFHFSGITPALSANAREITLDALRAAKRHGITVSCDLNYRSNLWNEETAGRVLGEMMEFTDLLIANENHLKQLFAISPEVSENDEDSESFEKYSDSCIAAAKLAASRFSLSQVALTVRRTLSADLNKFGALLYNGSKAYFSKIYTMDIVDRVGGGDSFSAGLIYSNLSGFDPQKSVEFAAAAGCLKHSIEGDVGIFSADEVSALAQGASDGRVRR